MSSLKLLKKTYDKLRNDRLRSAVLSAAEQLHLPKNIVRMDLNGCCNIQCIMCNQSNRCEKKKFMSLEDFKTIIDIFASTTRMLYLSCAYEPLITPHFTDYLSYAKAKKIPYISFCTNALLMTDEIITCIVDNNIDEVIISMNGFCEESYNRIMKGSDFDRVISNIEALIAYKEKRKTAKPAIRINTILMKSNLLDFNHMYYFLATHDIKTVQFRELMLLKDQNNPEEVKKELVSNLTQKAYEQVVQKINCMTEQLRASGKEVILPEKFGIYTSAQAASHSAKPPLNQSIEKKSNPRKQSCSIPCFSYWIDRDGGVRVCGYDEKGIIGNALIDDSKTLKKNRRLFQQMALSGECSRELCTINIDTSTVL